MSYGYFGDFEEDGTEEKRAMNSEYDHEAKIISFPRIGSITIGDVCDRIGIGPGTIWHVQKREVYVSQLGVHYMITRVGKNGLWADARATWGRAEWRQRVLLPLPVGTTRAASRGNPLPPESPARGTTGTRE